MAEGTDNVEGSHSCDDSLYERNLRLLAAAMVFTVNAMDGKMAVALQMRWEGALPV